MIVKPVTWTSGQTFRRFFASRPRLLSLWCTMHQIRGYEAHFRLCEFGTTLRPFWTNNDCLELFLTVWDHLGPFGTILDHFGQFWTILVRFHHIDPLGPKWLKWFKIVPNCPKWSQMVPNGPKWSQMAIFGPKWSKMIQKGFQKSPKSQNPKMPVFAVF